MSKKKSFIILFVLLFILIDIIVLGYVVYLQNYQNPEPKNFTRVQKEIYIAPYVGDIDGEVSEDWFFFYDKITDFHEETGIPVVFSFYPYSIQDDKEFNKIFKRMYDINNIELMQKGYKGDEVELRMDELSYEEQREIIKKGQDHFIEKMKEITGSDNIKIPVLYNQIGARFTNETQRAAESLGFIFYFDVYVGDYLNSIQSTESFDSTEYGISFTKTGGAGREEEFKTTDQIISEINNFSREDMEVLTIEGKYFIPLWAHQQDFEDVSKDNRIDEKKWQIYIETLNALNDDPNIKLITPIDAYHMRRKSLRL